MLNTYPCNPFPISSEQLHKGDNEELQAQINAIKDGTVIDSFGDVETALDTKADNDVIAPEFDAEAGTYEIGDLVLYEGKLYEFTSAHETAGEWDPTEVTETTVADELSSLESGLTNVGTYSTTQVKIGNWLGHDIYRKVVSLGALPNTTLLDVASGLTNEVIVNIYGIAFETNSAYTLPLPFISATQGNLIEIGYNNASHAIRVISTMDVSSFNGYVVLEYYTAG